MKRLIIATANTQFSRMLLTPNGLAPFKGVDVLTLQEVVEPEDTIKKILAKAGFQTIHAAAKFGLVIAVRSQSKIKLVRGTIKECSLQKMGRLETQLVRRSIGRVHQFNERGLLAIKLITPEGQRFTVATTHPTVPILPRARRTQINNIRDLLQEDYFESQLILTGDMNHYPRPKAVDQKLRLQASLLAVDLHGEPTWYARGSEQEKYLRIAARLRRRQIEAYNGQHDSILYRGSLKPSNTKVIDIASDHRAIITSFNFEQPTKLAKK